MAYQLLDDMQRGLRLGAKAHEAVPETVENNDALADDTAPAEQPAA